MCALSKLLRSRKAGPVALALTGVLLLAFQGSAQAGAGSEKLDSFLKKKVANATGSDWTSVIVQIPGGSPSQYRQMLAGIGAVNFRRLPLLDAFAVRVPTARLDEIAAIAGVSRISEDLLVLKSDEFTVGSSGAGLVFDQTGLDGEGIGVAVVDSGIRERKDLKGGSR